QPAEGARHDSHLDHERRRGCTVTAPAPITITPVRVADLLAEGERMPVYVHVIDHPEGRVLVDTGLTELHPLVADMDPQLRPPGATPGTQVVVVETGGRPAVVAGDVAVWSGELDEPHTEGQLLVRALDPELVWLTHTHEPWRPGTV